MRGAIAAGGPETVAAGAAMLKQGGNAVDAAVAAAFASFIAEIGVVHLGGSGLAHIYDASNGRATVYDFFSNTPGLNGTPPEKLDFAAVRIDFGPATQDFYLGRASVAVPGNIFGLCALAAERGRLPLRQLLQPAIRLAREGVAIEPFQAETCALLAPLYTHTAGMRQIFLKNGRMIQPGEHLYIPHLAGTLERLAEEGADFIRHGRLAQAIWQDQAENGGLLTPDDLARYQVIRTASIRVPYRQYEVLLPPPSSTGGALTAFTLKLLAHFDTGRLAHGSADHLRLLREVMAATNRARPIWTKYNDSLPAPQAVAYFLDDKFVAMYVAQVRQALDDGRPSPLAPEPAGPGNTSHISVVDGEGLAVSLTTTAGEGAGYVVPGTGFIPNNMMGEEDLHPNGFHAGRPGQRIPTMMTPALVLQNGRLRLVVGSGGSIRIRSAIVQVLSNLLDFGLTLDEAVNRARVHVENGALQCEAGFDETAVAQLETMGYKINRWPTRSIYFGGAHSVSCPPDGRLVAVGDNRRGGAVAVIS